MSSAHPYTSSKAPRPRHACARPSAGCGARRPRGAHRVGLSRRGRRSRAHGRGLPAGRRRPAPLQLRAARGAPRRAGARGARHRAGDAHRLARPSPRGRRSTPGRTTGSTYFGAVAGTPGFPRALARTLHDLAMAGVEPAALRRLPLGGPDLGALLEGFDEQFAAASATDRAALFSAACEGVRRVCRAAAPAARRAAGIRGRVRARAST